MNHNATKSRWSWAQITKRKPQGLDAWSHWEHGPDNNPVSTDTVIQAHHRCEEPWLNMLLARNGCNGTLLWSRKLPDGYLVHGSAFVATDDYFYLIDNDGCLRLDPETGRQIDRLHIPEVEGQWKYIALVNNVLYALAGTVPDSAETTVVRSEYTHWSWGELSPGYYQSKVPWGFGQTMLAYDTVRQKLLWRQRLSYPVMPGGLLVNRHGQVVVVHEDGSVSCFR